MCKRKYEWIRDREGNPKKMQNGGYVMQDVNGSCAVFDVETAGRVKELLDEITDFEAK